jgi:hypothetical protein
MIELFALFLLLHAQTLIGLVSHTMMQNSLKLSTLLDFFHTSPFLSFHFNLAKDSGKIHHYSLMAIVLLVVRFQLTFLADGLFFQAMVMKMAAINQGLF